LSTFSKKIKSSFRFFEFRVVFFFYENFIFPEKEIQRLKFGVSFFRKWRFLVLKLGSK